MYFTAAASSSDPDSRVNSVNRSTSAHGTSLHYVNVPEGDPASAALASLGGALDRRQLEMALPR